MEKNNAIFELLLMESLKGHRRFDHTFKKIGNVFNGLEIEYAIIGAVSMGITTSYQRFTKDIDILSYDQYRISIHHELIKNKFETLQDGLDTGEYMVRYTDTETNITVDILYSDDRIDPEASVVGLAIQATAFDTTVNVCIPEMTIWLCLHSNQTRHKADIVELLKTGEVDISRLGNYIKQADQSFLIDDLNELIIRANEELKPSKYNLHASTKALPIIN
ncbi:MAG: hypothetical protein WCR46_07025 [Deltaproteobacteria bacterium]